MFLRATVYPYAHNIIESLGLCRAILGMKAGITPGRAAEERRHDLERYHASLLRHSDQLGSVYAKAVFETRVSRFSGKTYYVIVVRCPTFQLVKSIKPFISIIEHLRRDLVRGSSFLLSHGHEPIEALARELGALGQSANDLMECILVSLDLVHDALIFAFELNIERIIGEPLLPLVKAATTRLSETVVALEALLQEESNKFTSELHVISDFHSLPTEENERRRRFHQLALGIINILDVRPIYQFVTRPRLSQNDR